MSGIADYFLVKTIDIDLGDVPDVDFQKLLSEQREKEIKSLRARLESLEGMAE
jgi:transcriptional regulatory protein LevR